MNPITRDSFGLLIAYLIPGATALLGLSQFSPALRAWFAGSPSTAPTIGGFLYLTVASLAAGMTLSAGRWLLVDSLHHRTGIRRPTWDFSRLGGSVDAFSVLIEVHYKYYEFYANMLLAIVWCYALWRGLDVLRPLAWPDAAFVGLVPVFFLASRDAIAKYYDRTAQLLAGSPRRGTLQKTVVKQRGEGE